ncbi:phosphopantetheine-binding protein [Burkholderia sp. JP2-270]|uniref:phosphopantetheine-binding protein n=1 Tax=Burkholderia sp. JP2-270 TaxID=2217913 RepID=UPI000DA4119F|nr:phosphopantetheine-binding protein [Burkholderia sp. JP2-270]AWV05253.1 phosphopantetheine-binding protein [Burkholderia sp. JP2-270]
MKHVIPAGQDLESTVLQVIAGNIADFMPGIDPAQVSIAGKLADYGCNSIDRMDIVWKTLDDLQLDIPVTEFSAVHDLSGLVALLCSFIGRRN